MSRDAYENVIKIQKLISGVVIREIALSDNKMNEFDCDSIIINENYIVSAEFSNIKFWNYENGQLIKIFKGHNDQIIHLDVCQDRHYLISTSFNKEIKNVEYYQWKIV